MNNSMLLLFKFVAAVGVLLGVHGSSKYSLRLADNIDGNVELDVFKSKLTWNRVDWGPDKGFEPWIQSLVAANPASNNESDWFDIRVSKAIGEKGYDKVRLSVLTYGEEKTVFEDFKFQYSEPFQGRWTHGYDLGRRNLNCSSTSIVWSGNVKFDAECLKRCNGIDACKFYTFYTDSYLCVLTKGECPMTKALNAVTYKKLGQHFLHSSVVSIRPGEDNEFTIGGKKLVVRVPREDAGTSGIVWADPCISSRWVECHYGQLWNTFENSYKMLNAVAKDPKVDFFQILGDNFYDQDGRLTKALFDRFSLEAKSKLFMTTVGNHDVWVSGGPSGDQPYDQYGHGFMQYYGQDTVASLKHDIFDFSVNPDDTGFKPYKSFRNVPENFLFYHKIGNLGFIGVSGMGDPDVVMPQLEQFCAYFQQTKPKFIFILGHFNKREGYLANSMNTPAIREHLKDIPGCDIGHHRLKFIDGHEHCNNVQKDQVGFLIGSHGMDDHACRNNMQYGFMYIDTLRDNKLRIYHFIEANLTHSFSEDILKCLNQHHSVHLCTQFADLWYETDL